MQVVIPMSGYGKRFRTKGYVVPKPLIKVDEKPIIQHVVNLFPNDCKFIFICNEDHLNNPIYKMKHIIQSCAKNSMIVPIKPHKLGPVNAIIQAKSYIDLEAKTIVNYADFFCLWNFLEFKKMVEITNCEGAIPAYKNFHPHTIWSNYYAYLKEKNMNLLDIKEKQSFTENPQQEFASTGTYYFKTGKILIDYAEKSMVEKLKVNGEFYASMIYKPMLKENKKIMVFEINHFMQWGTPEDLKDYQYWSKAFAAITREKSGKLYDGTLLLPMAGFGERFKEKGYKLPKPLNLVSSKPMAIQAFLDLPKTKKVSLILRKEMEGGNQLFKMVKTLNKQTTITMLNKPTNGQASSCMAGVFDINDDEPIVIGACDNGMIYDNNKYEKLIGNSNVDIIVWAIRGYPNAQRVPKMYGWIDVDEKTGLIKKISVKKPLHSKENDPIVIGTFSYKKLDYFKKSVQKMKKRKGKINNEYYIDTSINDAITLGYRCYIFEVDFYLCWGTPNDYETFNYWQKCFSNWNDHPYKLHLDPNYYT